MQYYSSFRAGLWYLSCSGISDEATVVDVAFNYGFSFSGNFGFSKLGLLGLSSHVTTLTYVYYNK